MRLPDKGGDGTVELLPGMAERCRRVERRGRIARMQGGFQDACVGLGGVHLEANVLERVTPGLDVPEGR